MVYIEDEIHCDRIGTFDSFEAALAELRRLAAIPWDAPPNRAPCSSWRTCCREYVVYEVDERGEQSKLNRKAHLLHVSAKAVSWIEGFEKVWHAGADDNPVANDAKRTRRVLIVPHAAAKRSGAADSAGALMHQFLEWVAGSQRTYAQTMDSWRTSCPRLTVWEDALANGFIEINPNAATQQPQVTLTPRGRAILDQSISDSRQVPLP